MSSPETTESKLTSTIGGMTPEITTESPTMATEKVTTQPRTEMSSPESIESKLTSTIGGMTPEITTESSTMATEKSDNTTQDRNVLTRVH